MELKEAMNSKISLAFENPKFQKVKEIMMKIDNTLKSEKLKDIQEDDAICGDYNIISTAPISKNSEIIQAMQHNQKQLGEYGLTFKKVFKMLREREKLLFDSYVTGLNSCFSYENVQKIFKIEEETMKARAGPQKKENLDKLIFL